MDDDPWDALDDEADSVEEAAVLSMVYLIGHPHVLRNYILYL